MSRFLITKFYHLNCSLTHSGTIYEKERNRQFLQLLIKPNPIQNKSKHSFNSFSSIIKPSIELF